MIYRTACWSVFLGGWGLAALSLHVVRTPEKIGLIPKDRLGFTDTFVDARKWTLSDASAHPELIRRVIEADKAELFRYMANPSSGDIAQQLSAQISNSPAAQSTSMFDSVKGLFGTAASQAGGTTLKGASFPVDF
jgi:hypothetical protein